MKVSEVMNGKTPNAEFEGFATNDDFILAIQIDAEGQTTEKDYTVVQQGVTSHEASLDAETDDKQYIRTGKVTTKTGTSRTFAVSGDRYVGDPFQDFCMDNKIKFGTGSAIVVPYVYFCMLTGKGEKGKVRIIVNDDQTGDAGENAGFSVDLTAQGTPEDYTYNAS